MRSDVSSNKNPVEANLTLRDWAQSNHGTNITAEDFIAAFEHVLHYDVNTYQTAGGTFHDLLIRKGWNPFEFNRIIGNHFKDLTQTALVRGECGFGYSRQPLDVLGSSISRYAMGGINIFHNFSPMNDINIMRGVPIIVNKLHEDMGLDVYAQGGIVIQENPNTKSEQIKILSGIYSFARDLLLSGHKDFYLKNANGILRPDFVFELVQGLNERFDEKVYLHMHNTYGLAYENYMAAAEAGVTGLDFLPHVLAEGTAQPSLETYKYAALKSKNQIVIDRIPVLSLDSMNKDRDAQIVLRATNSKFEMPYSPEKLAIAKDAGSAGGAISALKGMDSVIRPLLHLFETDDFNTVQVAIYEQKAKNREDLGYPSNVTPLELMQDVQAAIDVMSIANGGEAFDLLGPITLDYLTGALGKVSDTVNPSLQKRALDYRGLDHVVILNSIEDLEPGLPSVRASLVNAGINATKDDVAIVASSGDDGLKLVNGDVKSQQAVPLLMDQQKGGDLYEVAPSMFRVAYAAVELTRLRGGFYSGVNGLDERADYLEYDMMQEINDIAKKLADGKYDSSVVAKANRYISALASGLGADSKHIMNIDMKNFVKQAATVRSSFIKSEPWDGGALADVGMRPTNSFETAVRGDGGNIIVDHWDNVMGSEEHEFICEEHGY